MKNHLSVAFIGLGAMGYRMAAHLPQAFHDVRVWNRTSAKAEQHAVQYGTQAVSLEQATQADIIFSCLPTSAEVEQIIRHHPPKAGAIWVDCTSGEPESAKRMVEFLQQYQADFLDAPVSGQTIGAEKGTLTVMVGGDAEAFARAYIAIEPFAGLIQHVGTSGAGFAVKAVNNMMLAVHLWAAAEGFTTLKANGVDLNSALQCINASSGKSAVTEMILPQRILNRSFPCTFALPLLAKDTGIALSLAQQAKLPTPLLSLTQNLTQAANLNATPEHDFSTLVQFYEQWTKITLE
ncbi:MAG: NAD(P)-dependent oxidoreductase [Acinetobacter sp.]|nr:MAG: NAD(P)-dependent oxidoreductase [Acinetobacter sp.]